MTNQENKLKTPEMSKSEHPITYVYEVDGHLIEITRRHTGTAYARNGNVGNPTEYFKWEAKKDGVYLGMFSKRSDAYEEATGHAYCDRDGRVIGRNKQVRYFNLVRDEMQANYRGRVQHNDVR